MAAAVAAIVERISAAEKYLAALSGTPHMEAAMKQQQNVLSTAMKGMHGTLDNEHAEALQKVLTACGLPADMKNALLVHAAPSKPASVCYVALRYIAFFPL